MIFLYLSLDILFYNFTFFKTNLYLISVINKKISYLKIFLSSLIIDLFITHTIYFIIIMPFLKFLSSKIKKYRFSIILLIYLSLTYLCFKKIGVNIPGLIINYLILILSCDTYN